MIHLLRAKFKNLISDKRFSEIFKGSAWALSARVVSMMFGFAFSVVVARFYGAEMVGIIAVINSFLMLVTIFTLVGTNTSILRLIPEHVSKYSHTSAFKVYRKSLVIVITISFLVSIIIYLGSGFIANKIFSKDHFSFYFSLVSIFIVFKSILQFNTEAIRGLKLIRIFSLVLFLPQFFDLLFISIGRQFFANENIPVFAVLFGITVASLIGWTSVEYVFKKRIQNFDQVFTINILEILSISLPMLMSSAMIFIISQTGVMILGMFRSEAEVGHYAIAVKLATLTAFVLQAVNSMAGPKFSELFYKKKLDELFFVAKKSTKLIFFTTAPILIVLLCFGRPILNIVFGIDFVVAYPALVILVIGQFINSISGSNGMFLNMTGHQIVFRNIMCVAALLNVALSSLLIPHLGINGAAISATFSLCCWNIATLLYMKYKFGETTGYFPGFTTLNL